MSVVPKDCLSVKKENVNLKKKKKSLYHKSQTPTQKQMDNFKENTKTGISISELDSLHNPKKDSSSLGDFPIKDTSSLSPSEYVSPCVPVPTV